VHCCHVGRRAASHTGRGLTKTRSAYIQVKKEENKILCISRAPLSIFLKNVSPSSIPITAPLRIHKVVGWIRGGRWSQPDSRCDVSALWFGPQCSCRIRNKTGDSQHRICQIWASRGSTGKYGWPHVRYQPCRGAHYPPQDNPKCWQVYTKLHGVISHTTIVFSKLFICKLPSLSVTIEGWKNELERIWKEKVVTYFEVFFQNTLGEQVEKAINIYEHGYWPKKYSNPAPSV